MGGQYLRGTHSPHWTLRERVWYTLCAGPGGDEYNEYEYGGQWVAVDMTDMGAMEGPWSTKGGFPKLGVLVGGFL